MAVGNVTNGLYTEKDFFDLKQKCQEFCQKFSYQEEPKIFREGSLHRFLRAWQSVDAAYTAVTKSQKWREEYGVEQLTEDDPDIQEEIRADKASVLPHRDMNGRPVVYIAARRHNAYDRDIERLTKFIVFNLDFSISNMDYQFVKNLIWLLSKHYPERLGVCLIVNSPIIFWGCWPIIRPWLNEVTASKVTFANESQLSEYIHPSILPSGEVDT